MNDHSQQDVRSGTLQTHAKIVDRCRVQHGHRMRNKRTVAENLYKIKEYSFILKEKSSSSPHHYQCGRYEFAAVAKQHESKNRGIEFRVLLGRGPVHHLLTGIGAHQRCGQHRNGNAHQIENSERCYDRRKR